ncbi:hypothetical protein [Thalassolituus maritimus]|uniref:Iron transporter n=1 Tax=Thalassolituus maritimus TaxID=484498 RepID=A0ABP9ZX32_9GAMM
MLVSSERWLFIARVFAAAVGGYALSTVISLLLLMVLDYEGREARMFTGMAFFLAYVTIVIVAFSIYSHKKAVGVLLLGNVGLWGIWYLVGGTL